MKPCLDALRLYGGAARSQIPRLRELTKELAAKNWKPDALAKLGIAELIEEIENAEEVPELRPLD